MKTLLLPLISFLLVASSCAVVRHPGEQAPPKYRRYYERHQRINSRHRQTTSAINN